jgi:hypothetical protein
MACIHKDAKGYSAPMAGDWVSDYPHAALSHSVASGRAENCSYLQERANQSPTSL